MHILLLPTKEAPLQNINQLIQSSNAKIRMRMLAQMTVPLINQQHRCRPGRMSGCHIVNAISDLQHGQRKG